MKTFIKGIMAGALALGLGAGSAAGQGDWPNRPVTLIVAAGAGGGTDFTGRLLAEGLEERLGQPFNVVNRAEGGGIAGITELSKAKPDGYTIGILFNYAPYKLLGMGNLTSDSFTPIAQYNFDSAAVFVKTGSEMETLDQIVGRLKEDPKSLQIGCGATCPSSWSSALSKILIDEGIDISKLIWVPNAGAAGGLQELVAGGVDVLTASVPEAASLMDAGEVRAIAVLAEERLDAFPEVPTAGEQIEDAAPGGVFRAMVGPAGMPNVIADKLEATMKDIYESEDFQAAMKKRGFGLQYRNSEELLDWMKRHEKDTEQVLRAAGLI